MTAIDARTKNGFDVAPIPGPVIHSLEYDECFTSEYGNRSAFEGYFDDTLSHLTKELVSIEEHIYRSVVPHQSHLPVVSSHYPIRGRDGDFARHRIEHRIGPIHADENVHIDVSRAARFLRAIGQRDRSTERVRNSLLIQSCVNREQAL